MTITAATDTITCTTPTPHLARGFDVANAANHQGTCTMGIIIIIIIIIMSCAVNRDGLLAVGV